MGKFEDYINSLDKKGTLDPLIIVSSLKELHDEEISSAEGKIASVQEELNTAKTDLASNEKIITGLKAKNWDLVNRVPADNANSDTSQDNNNNNPGNESFDDFFEESK